MKILLKDLLEKIENGNYTQDLEAEKYLALTKSKVKIISQNLVKQVLAALRYNSLAHVRLGVTGQGPVSFVLETNVVNLPYANYKKTENLVSVDESLPIKVCFEVSGEYIDASKFWIRGLAGVDDLNEEIIADHSADLINQKLVDVRNHIKSEETVSVKKTKEETKKKSWL